MNKLAKNFFVGLTLLGLLFPVLISPSPLASQTQFSTGYDITFDFQDNGQARVTQQISLTNLTSEFYASEFSLSISSDKVTNVSGSDGLGAINVTTKTSNGTTNLVATLNQKIVGQNKTVNFQIAYSIDSLAIKRGKVWEINLPKYVTSENVTGYKLTIRTPQSFGKLGKMTPAPDQSDETGDKNQYIYTKLPNSESGIGASFGEFQQFKFNLKYRYKNSNLYTAKASIALPPDTEYQAMYYTEITPKPVSMEVDDSGNYIATYHVKGGKSLEVLASGYVRLIDATTPYQKPKDWSSKELEQFTKADRYIESENQQIQKKAKELKDVREIYSYLVSTLKYDYSRLEKDSLGRRGALTAFNKPEQSICTDFSDLFVALARAKGIPARGLVGFAYTDNTNLRPTRIEGLVDTTVLHAWPEYYDKEKERWVQIDPTWGQTTGGIDYFERLDTNHFVFVINGSSSQLPLPAGAYKTSENQIDDVKVEFSEDNSEIKPDLNIDLIDQKVISGFPSNSKLMIENKTGRALFKANLAFTNNLNLKLVDPESMNLGTILPFETRTESVRLRSNSILDDKSVKLQINLNAIDKDAEFKLSKNEEVQIKPFFSFDIPQTVLLTILLVVIASWVYPFLHRRANKAI